MAGTRLGTIRSHVEGPSGERGTYFLVCARYGDRPMSASSLPNFGSAFAHPLRIHTGAHVRR